VKRPTITQLMIQKPAKLTAAEASAKAGCGHEKGPCRGLSHVHHAIAQWLVFTPPHWLGFAPPLTQQRGSFHDCRALAGEETGLGERRRQRADAAIKRHIGEYHEEFQMLAGAGVELSRIWRSGCHCHF
jgi:hypothetical protein